MSVFSVVCLYSAVSPDLRLCQVAVCRTAPISHARSTRRCVDRPEMRSAGDRPDRNETHPLAGE